MPIEYDLETDNYVGTHNFQVKIAGIDVINTEFTAISGLVSETKMESGSTDPAAGQVVYAPITLTRIYKGVDDFYGWRLEVENGNIKRRDVTITMMDSAFRAIRAMTLEKAWPSKWEMPDLDASSSGPANEKITLTCARVRESAPG